MALDGPEWLRRRRAAGYEALTSCELPTESEEVWRYTPINSLVLDDFEPPAEDRPVPAGDQLLAAATAALGSVAVSVLVHNGRAGIFTRYGRRVWLRAGRGRARVGRGTGVRATGWGCAGAPQRRLRARPGLRRRSRGRARRGARAHCALVRQRIGLSPDERAGPARDRRFPSWRSSPGPRAQTQSHRARHRAGRRRTARQSTTSPCRSSGTLPGRSPVWPDGLGQVLAAHLHRRPGCRLRPGAGRRLGRGEGRPQRNPLRLLGRRNPGARHPHAAGPRGPADDERAAVPGSGRRHVALGLQRADPGPPRGGAQRRPADQPQPGSRRGSARRLGAQSRHSGERRPLLPCFYGGPLDEDQRYYIESRGVAPEVAEGLIVRGFFDAIIDRSPVPEVIPFLQREVHDRLKVALGGRALPAGV